MSDENISLLLIVAFFALVVVIPIVYVSYLNRREDEVAKQKRHQALLEVRVNSLLRREKDLLAERSSRVLSGSSCCHPGCGTEIYAVVCPDGRLVRQRGELLVTQCMVEAGHLVTWTQAMGCREEVKVLSVTDEVVQLCAVKCG